MHVMHRLTVPVGIVAVLVGLAADAVPEGWVRWSVRVVAAALAVAVMVAQSRMTRPYEVLARVGEWTPTGNEFVFDIPARQHGKHRPSASFYECKVDGSAEAVLFVGEDFNEAGDLRVSVGSPLDPVIRIR